MVGTHYRAARIDPTETHGEDATREAFESQIPAGRLGQGAEAAELALALATSASDFLAGQVIPISGGWTT